MKFLVVTPPSIYQYFTMNICSGGLDTLSLFIRMSHGFNHGLVEVYVHHFRGN